MMIALSMEKMEKIMMKSRIRTMAVAMAVVMTATETYRSLCGG